MVGPLATAVCSEYSPYSLMFGREARLPVDLCFGLSADGVYPEIPLWYVTQMRAQLKEAYKVATEAARQKQRAQQSQM